MKNLTDQAVDHPRVVIVLTMLVIALAGFAGMRIPVQRTPAIHTAIVMVAVPYPGAQPTEVEERVTRKIEEALQRLNNVDFITSTSMRGSSITQVIFLDGTESKRARDDVEHLAKPAALTPLCAAYVVSLLHKAGIPQEVLHFLPGSGNEIGMRLVSNACIAGVAFTGSLSTARQINQVLAQGERILPLIAETAGQNCMIVDSSALPEQVVKDVMVSAFNSAGQRCSALRVLFLQQEIAPQILEMLSGAMGELHIGNPMHFDTDIGPVISFSARDELHRHSKRMDHEARLIKAMPLPPESEEGSYFAPRVYEIDKLEQLQHEVFGPILHVIRYQADRLNEVLDSINNSGYGLTLGIHSRIDATVDFITRHSRCGNTYVNRNLIGAVVGSQPFGGEGLSGTGPKAGGPHYLQRFAAERVVTINTAAVGGNVGLLSTRKDTG